MNVTDVTGPCAAVHYGLIILMFGSWRWKTDRMERRTTDSSVEPSDCFPQTPLHIGFEVHDKHFLSCCTEHSSYVHSSSTAISHVNTGQLVVPSFWQVTAAKFIFIYQWCELIHWMSFFIHPLNLLHSEGTLLTKVHVSPPMPASTQVLHHMPSNTNLIVTAANRAAHVVRGRRARTSALIANSRSFLLTPGNQNNAHLQQVNL